MNGPAANSGTPRGRRSRVARWAWRGCVGVACLVLAAGWALDRVPLPPALRVRAAGAGRVELLDRRGQPLRVRPDEDGRVGRPLAEADIPQAMIDATLAAEDARFLRHVGVDPWAILRAAGQWVRHRRVVSGASTIPQQLIKLAEPRPRTLRTKLVEAVQAVRLEREWDKPSILRAYLGQIDYGNGCAGLTEAAWHYFGKRPADLDLAESALLAGLPQSPSRLNPRRHPGRARARQAWILGRCLQLGWITSEAHDRALEEPLRFVPPRREFAAPHFADHVLGRLPAGARSGMAAAPAGWVTTLDLPLQARCEESVRQRLAGLEGSHVGDAAVVVLENRTGDVLAMVGSADWSRPDDGQVNGTLARRSPGSALKPFTYLLAFTDGATAADIVADVPTGYPTATGVFQPANYDRRFRGPVSLREALGNSLNVPAVRVLSEHGGAARLQAMLRSTGLTTLELPADHYGLGLTLGAGEVRLLELANAYATLARGGEWLPVRVLTSTPVPAPRRVASSDACWLVADVLRDPAARAAAFGLETPLRFDFPVACKTGTSSGFRDNWAFGFTPEFTVGVWVGNFDGTPMRDVSGVVGAAPILHDVLEALHASKGTGWYPEPPALRRAMVDPLTGHRLGAGVPGARPEVFLGDAMPPWSRPDDRDEWGRVRLSLEYADWAASADNRWGDRIVVGAGAGGDPLRVLSPVPGTVFFLDDDLPASAQRIGLRASADCRWRCASLSLDERSGRTQASLALGRHRLEAVDPRTGRQAETWIEVRRR